MTPTYIVLLAICENSSVSLSVLQKHLFQVKLKLFCFLLSKPEAGVDTAEEGTAFLGSPRQHRLFVTLFMELGTEVSPDLNQWFRIDRKLVSTSIKYELHNRQGEILSDSDSSDS